MPGSTPARSILIVDDNAAIRRELCEIFTAHDYHVCAEAENGRRGIELARVCRPDLIVLDLSMPVMNGLDAAPELRKIVPDSPIILFTLFADAVSRDALESSGITMALSKNEPMEHVIAAAEELFQA